MPQNPNVFTQDKERYWMFKVVLREQGADDSLTIDMPTLRGYRYDLFLLINHDEDQCFSLFGYIEQHQNKEPNRIELMIRKVIV